MKFQRVGSPIVSLLVLMLMVNMNTCRPTQLLAAAERPLATQQTSSSSTPTAQDQWNQVLRDGQKEGKLVITTAASSGARTQMGQAFKEKTGIEIEWIGGRPAELLEKFRRERGAEIYSLDVYWGSSGPIVSLWKPNKMLDPLAPLLVLPEAIDPNVWHGKKLRFLDKDKTAYTSSLYPLQPMLINTDMVKTGDINSYADLLAPKWKAKIVMNDPTIDGVGIAWFEATTQKITSPDYMRQLAKQEPILIRDERLMLEWVVRAKYPVVIAPQMTNVADFMRMSAPITYLTPSDGSHLMGAMGVVAVFNKAPHPKAAQVFVNWFLSKDGQTLNSKLNMTDSARLDINTDFLPSYVRRQQGVKYFDAENEEFLLSRPKMKELAIDIFGSLIRK